MSSNREILQCPKSKETELKKSHHTFNKPGGFILYTFGSCLHLGVDLRSWQELRLDPNI